MPLFDPCPKGEAFSRWPLVVSASIFVVFLAVLTACERQHPLPSDIQGTDCGVSTTTLDFGVVLLGGSSDLTFTLTDNSNGPIAGTLSESCGEFQVVGSTSYSLDPGASTTFTVRFTPSSAGQSSCALAAGGDCPPVSLTGVGQSSSPACDVFPTRLEFGGITVGNQSDLTVRVLDAGSTRLTGTLTESCPDFSVVGDASYDLGPGEHQDFTVRFKPVSSGEKSCTLDAGGVCSDISLFGTGRDPDQPACSVSATSLDFGSVNVGQTADRTFTVTNSGSGTLSGTATESCSEFSIVGSAYALGAGQSATITVRFSPASGGAKSCTINPGTLCATVSAGGTGVAVTPPACQLSTTALSFGTVTIGSSANRTFTIANSGGGTLSGTVSESCAEFSIVGDATYSLGAGQSQTFTVRYTPVTAGDESCTIETGSSACADVAASGTGALAATCQLSATTIDFGTIAAGETAHRSLTVGNIGTGTLSGNLTESCAQFSIAGTPSYSLGPLASATFDLVFSPTVGGDFQCTLNAGSNCGTVTLLGTATGTGICQLSTTTLDFGNVKVGDHKDLTVTVRNIGNADLCGTPAESCDGFRWLGTAYCVIPGGTLQLKVRFQPGSAGTYSCTVDPGAGCGPVTVVGAGTP